MHVAQHGERLGCQHAWVRIGGPWPHQNPGWDLLDHAGTQSLQRLKYPGLLAVQCTPDGTNQVSSSCDSIWAALDFP